MTHIGRNTQKLKPKTRYRPPRHFTKSRLNPPSSLSLSYTRAQTLFKSNLTPFSLFPFLLQHFSLKSRAQKSSSARLVVTMNIFRFAGDMTHLISILVLLLKIYATKSCSGNFTPPFGSREN